MKKSSKVFEKTKVYIKNALSDKEMDEISQSVENYKGCSLTLENILKIEKSKAKQSV